MTRAGQRQCRRDQITAYHEAGHAVMAVLNRMPLQGASILARHSDESAGRTRLSTSGVISKTFASGRKLGEREYRQVLRGACFSLAGEIAQRRFAPRDRRIDHSWSDLENVSRLLHGIGLSGAKLRAVAKAVAVQADRVLEAHWSRIEAVANAFSSGAASPAHKSAVS